MSEAEGGLRQSLVRSLKEKIVGWHYPPGYRLLESDICSEYGVSRSPAREALTTLLADGFVEKLPRRGYRVKQLDVRRAKELYDVRLALELFVVETLVAAGGARADLRRLREEWSDAEADQSASAFAERDRQFHERLAELAGNETLLEQLRGINERIHVFRMIEFAREDATKQETGEQHRRILDAVIGGRRDEARQAMRLNIESASSNIEASIKEALARSYLGGQSRM
jgi:DNA-binding GntR family transcriptional regulator